MSNVKVNFDESTHTYTVNGRALPSVTQICRFANIDIAANSKPWLKELGAARGTAVHEATMLMDYGEDIPDDFPTEWFGYLNAYRRFLNDLSPSFELIETPLADVIHGYAGTPDRYGIINGKKTVLDIKTNTKLNHFYCAAQLDGYTDLLKANGYEVESRLCLHLDKGGTYELFEMPFSNIENCVFVNFFSMLCMHNALNNYKGEKI